MKVAMTSSGNSKDSHLDSHFGRSAYFALYDTVTRHLEFIENPYRDTGDGSGVAAAELIIAQNAGKVVSGEIGSKIIPVLNAAGIQLIIMKREIRISDLINMLNH